MVVKTKPSNDAGRAFWGPNFFILVVARLLLV